jgi:hypothetical protein
LLFVVVATQGFEGCLELLCRCCAVAEQSMTVWDSKDMLLICGKDGGSAKVVEPGVI